MENQYSMNHTLLDIYKKQLPALAILFGLSLIAWYSDLLLSFEKRIDLSILLFLIWILKFIFVDTQPKKLASSFTKQSPDTVKKMGVLQGKLKGAIAFLKKTNINKHGKNIPLSTLPWYLFIGPNGAGKTTLLANSNINFILSKHFKTENTQALQPSDSCDFWVTRDLVLVDVPGHYLISSTKHSPQSQTNHTLWRHLLMQVKRFHGKKPIHGVVIALQLPELIKQQKNTQKNQLAIDLRKRIQDLLDQFGPTLPIHLIITKCDLLPGFYEFFNEYSNDESAQAWGVTLQKTHESDALIDICTQRFNALIKRLNKQLITRLHQERNVNARSYIKDFPLHIEHLKESTIQFLKALMLPNLQLQSIYLTSGKQDAPHDEQAMLSTTSTSHYASGALSLLATPTLPSRAYFVRQLILHNLLITTQNPKPITKQSIKPRITYTIATIVILTACIILGCDFKHSIQQPYAIQNELAHYQHELEKGHLQGNHLVQALPLLNALQRASTHSADKLLLTFYSEKSQKTATAVYHRALQTIVLTEIKLTLERYLQHTENKNPEQVYGVLKAYLMLGDASHANANYIIEILHPLLSLPNNKTTVAQLNYHIHEAIKVPQTAIPLNNALITEVRRQLLSLPNTALGLVILKNMANNRLDNAIVLGTHLGNPPVFTSHSIALQIQNLFTANAFTQIVNQQINQVASETLQGNWVLGIHANNTDTATIDALAAELRTQYIANYIDIWESLLANLKLNTPRNLAECDAMIAILTSNTSPLLQLLDTIKRNTAFTPIMAASPKLQSLSALLANANNNETTGLYSIFITLKELHNYLQSMLSTQEGVIQATSQRFQNASNDPITQIQKLAQQSPEPMKSWLNTIAAQTWNLMVNESAAHIETAWQKNIMPTYHTAIANRYPFNQTALNEVDLTQFSKFLGQQGSLSRFYHYYLKPFVNENNNEWTFRELDNVKLPFSNAVLAQFKQLAMLQRAFFPNGDNKLYVQFTLQPIALDKLVKNFTLSINGQPVIYPKELTHTPHLLTWPGNNNNHMSGFHFVANDNHPLASTIQGDWGWFKLVNQFTQNINTRKELTLSFESNGHRAQYLLFTQGKLNPFLPLNLTRFELPEQLA